MIHRLLKFASTLSAMILLIGLLSCEKNYPPRIFNTEFARLPGIGSTSFVLSVEASDANHDPMTYLWEAEAGEFIEDPEQSETTWAGPQPDQDTEYLITVTVSDGKESTVATLTIPLAAPTFGRLTGFAFFTGTTVPIHEAIISIQGKTDTTDFEGQYEIDGVRSGRQTVFGTKTDFTKGETDLIIQEGINEANVYMSSPKNSTRLYGTCMGNNSLEPKANLEIIVLNPDKSDSDLRALSDLDGSYEIPLIPHGLRYIIVRDENSIRGETLVYLETEEYLFNVPIREPFSFTDNRDGRTYGAVRIGGQVWMAENLAYLPHVSPSIEQGGIWVYGYHGSDVNEAKATDNYSTYGCLYDWHTAMDDNHGNGKDICPDGWHLPTDDEWKSLELTMGMEYHELDSVGWRLTGDVGRKLKASLGWDVEGNGSNSSSFTALPGGNRTSAGAFAGVPGYANFWMASTWSEDELYGWRRYLFYNRDAIGRYSDFKTTGSSVRCVRDN